MMYQQHSNYFVSVITEAYKNKGNDEYEKKDFSKAIYFYTKGIKVNCRDDELNTKLYSNRAIAHFYLGENVLIFRSEQYLLPSCDKMIKVEFFYQGIIMIHLMMQELPLNCNPIIWRRS